MNIYAQGVFINILNNNELNLKTELNGAANKQNSIFRHKDVKFMPELYFM